MREVLVLTMLGLHVLQCDLSQIHERVANLMDLMDEVDHLERLVRAEPIQLPDDTPEAVRAALSLA